MKIKYCTEKIEEKSQVSSDEANAAEQSWVDFHANRIYITQQKK